MTEKRKTKLPGELASKEMGAKKGAVKSPLVARRPSARPWTTTTTRTELLFQLICSKSVG